MCVILVGTKGTDNHLARDLADEYLHVTTLSDLAPIDLDLVNAVEKVQPGESSEGDLIDALVVALDIPGPPSETTFVADAGRRQRAESFSAGTARTVTRKDLDMIWLRDERPLQTAEDLFGTLETGVDTVGSFVE